MVAETPETTVAYLEHQADATTTDSPATVALLCSRFDWLRTEAYRGSESLALIEEMAEKWKLTFLMVFAVVTLARLDAQYAYLMEYQSMLGQMRKQLPDLECWE